MALQRLRCSGLLPSRGPDWVRLLQTVHSVPLTITLPLLCQWPYGMLKEPCLATDFYVSLTKALQRGADSPAGQEDGVGARAASQDAQRGVGRQGHRSAVPVRLD